MMKRRFALGAAGIALVLSGCGGDDKKTTTSPATTRPAPSDAVEAPNEGDAPAGAAGQLPPEFVRCMADQGYEIESPAEFHSAPPEVLQTCFGSLHGGGGGP